MDLDVIPHLIVECFLMSLLVYFSLLWKKERSELLDRLYARDLPELASVELERQRDTNYRPTINDSVEI